MTRNSLKWFALFNLINWIGLLAWADDLQLCESIRQRRSERFIQAENIWIEQILPDDTIGSQHQRWIGRLSCGERITLVYNISLCDRVPVQEGDSISAGGELLVTNREAILHWLHEDPKGRRPHGFVILNGKKYGILKKFRKSQRAN